jgi:histidine ammonia-lyase
MMGAIGALRSPTRPPRAPASAVAAMSVEALPAPTSPMRRYQLARPHPGQWRSPGCAISYATRRCRRATTPRAQVGPVWPLRAPGPRGGARLPPPPRLDIELSSATDNPLVFPGRHGRADTAATGGSRVISGALPRRADCPRLDWPLALAELGSISERRTASSTRGSTAGYPHSSYRHQGSTRG